jgi:membrane protease subunit HflC
MQAYKDIISTGTTLVLSTDSDLFKFLEGMHSRASNASDHPPDLNVELLNKATTRMR